MIRTTIPRLFGVALLLAASVAPANAAAQTGKPFITVASTTSTDASGLFKHLLPKFTAKTAIAVRVIAVGTGQALRIARNGDADVLFVHHKPSEEKFVAEGYGLKRHDVMYNDFILLGPKADPVGIRGSKDITAALKRIADKTAVFASRGDDSGTHKREHALWNAAGVNVKAASGAWYRELGSGMGATLNTAAALGAYTLADRGTWISFANKANLDILVEGDRRLFNPYGVIVVSPKKFPHVKADLARKFAAWLTAAEGQQAIANFKLRGQRLFHPNARDPGS